MQRRTSVFLLGLFVFSLFMPFASSNHGQPHGMLMCWDIINEEDGCDIYSPTDDLSSFASDFVQSSYTFEMVDTSTINLQMNLAIHEFNRSTIGFDDITIENPLNGEDATVSDLLRDVENVGDGGAPADLIRHFFDENVLIFENDALASVKRCFLKGPACQGGIREMSRSTKMVQ